MMKEKRFFTLIELMVVIAIITILFAILMPALSHAKAVAKSIICKGNIKQMSTALQLYSNDNCGVCAPTYHIVARPSDDIGWLTLVARSGYLKQSFLEGEGRCPTNPIKGATEGDVDGINYMRATCFGYDNWDGGGAPIIRKTVKMASIRFPSITPEVSDACYYDGTNNINDSHGCRWAYDSFVSIRTQGILFPGWHLGQFNINFADTHIEEVPMTSSAFLDWKSNLTTIIRTVP